MFLLSDMSYRERLEFLWNLVSLRKPFILLGPAGSGKSYVGLRLMERFIREHFGLDYSYVGLQDVEDDDVEGILTKDRVKGLYIAGSANVTKFDVLGGRTLVRGSYVRRRGFLTHFRARGGIIFFDEITSIPPSFTVLLNEVLDSIIMGRAHKDFFVFFAGNPSVYIGTEELPTSTLERLIVVYYDYYPLSDEVSIVKEKLRTTLDLEAESLDVYTKFVVMLVRKLRNLTLNAGYRVVPLSVRSMENLAITAYILGKRNKSPISFDSKRLENLYAILHGDLPKSKSDVYADEELKLLVSFLKENGISPEVLRTAILMLGSLADYVEDKNFVRMVTSIV